MFKIDSITKDWKEAGAFMAQVNLYGFWDEHCFLTKSGDLGCALKVGGMIDAEGLDHAGRDYVVKRLEAALRSLDEKTRLYQVLFRHNRPTIPHAEYTNPLVRAAVEQRAGFLAAKADRLYSVEIFWIVMVDGSYAKTGLLHALSQLPQHPRSALGMFGRDLRALLSGSKERTLLYEQIERDRMRLEQKAKSLSGQLSDLIEIELLGAEKTFRLVRRFVNFCPLKIEQSKLHGMRHLDWQMCDSELEAHRGHLRLDDFYVRVLTLKELPSETRPLLLQGLLAVPANFHVVTEWHPVDNARARKEINKRRRHHHNSKTSFLSNLQEQKHAGPREELVDDSKEAAVAELGEALTALGMEGKSFGEFTLTVVIYDEDRIRVEHAVAEFQKLFTQHDGLLYEERYNLLNAFFATVPGNKHFNLRKQWALNSNYADLSFLFTVDTGSQWNAHLEREHLAVLETAHATPYYFNLHSGDVAHTLLLGATGSGKSFLLNFLLESFQKYSPLTFSRFQTFNFDGWSDAPDVLEPLLFYVLHQASAEIEKPENTATFKCFVIDEAWMFLKNATIREWIVRAEKTWRKKNAAMVLATQSVVELAASEMLHVVHEYCPTKIFLANPNMDRKLYAEVFQLNDTELELLESLVPKRDILLKQPNVTKKLRLDVDALTYWIATNNSRDNLRKQEYFARYGPEQGLLRLAHDYSNPTATQ